MSKLFKYLISSMPLLISQPALCQTDLNSQKTVFLDQENCKSGERLLLDRKGTTVRIVPCMIGISDSVYCLHCPTFQRSPTALYDKDLSSEELSQLEILSKASASLKMSLINTLEAHDRVLQQHDRKEQIQLLLNESQARIRSNAARPNLSWSMQNYNSLKSEILFYDKHLTEWLATPPQEPDPRAEAFQIHNLATRVSFGTKEIFRQRTNLIADCGEDAVEQIDRLGVQGWKLTSARLGEVDIYANKKPPLLKGEAARDIFRIMSGYDARQKATLLKVLPENLKTDRVAILLKVARNGQLLSAFPWYPQHSRDESLTKSIYSLKKIRFEALPPAYPRQQYLFVVHPKPWTK